MSETLSLSGHEYIPATLAGKHFGYTGDYITKLAREGKVEGTKVGHQWFVVESSVKYFVEHKTKEKSVRSEAVRQERKQELRAHKEKEELLTKTQLRSHHTVALVETLVILIIGLSLGASGYVMTAPSTQPASLASTSYSAIERLAVKLYSFVTGGTEVTRVETMVSEKVPTQNDAQGEPVLSVALGTTTRTSIIVAPDEVFTATTVESVRDAFSDDVSVSIDPNNPDTGIITPHFKEKDGEAYRFLLAPINAQGG